MTSAEAMEKAQAAQAQAQKSIYHHNLAMQAFGVACARFDWDTAAKEHSLALDYMDAYLCALQGCQRITEEMER